MKRILVFLAIFISCISSVAAQWVTVPDSNFVIWLNNNGFASCISGNQLNTSCSLVINDVNLNCSNAGIVDLTGIEYFVNLKYLDCSRNQLTSLPLLTDSLRTLDCSENYLGSLPVLSDSLYELDCSGNLLSSLPVLPNKLSELKCAGNQLSYFPPLPNTLTFLLCGSNNFSSLPSLPNNIWYLDCSYNLLTVLPAIPDSCIYLYCRENFLTTISGLPNKIRNLDCEYNQITSIQSLPDSLKYLYVSNNQLASLPNISPALIRLDCQYNLLTALPSLPNSITHIDCYNNQITSMAALPVSLVWLKCYNNQISSFFSFPNGLEIMDCSYNQLTSLPALPDSLFSFQCDHNILSSLPALPAALSSMDCSHNALTTLPLLPGNLSSINCSSNLLSNLPAIPSSLSYLVCGYNQISAIPYLSDNVQELRCEQNQLTSIFNFPDSLVNCWIDNNLSLTCLPELKHIEVLRFYNTNVQCLPNYGNIDLSFPAINTVSLCDIFNANSCDFYYKIAGNVYSDNNSNCVNEPSEFSISGLKINLYQSGFLVLQGYSSQNGLYTLNPPLGVYEYSPDTSGMPFNVICPSTGSYTSSLTAGDSIDLGMNFGLECKPGFDIGANAITRISGQFFPGDTSIIKITAGDISHLYNLSCASGISGNLTVYYAGPITFSGALPGSLIPVLGSNFLEYTIPDFGAIDMHNAFRFFVKTDTTAQSSQQVCFTVVLTPSSGDNNTVNNQLTHCFEVINSLDPNSKEVSPVGNIELNQQWLSFTIWFQNTGTATAQNIVITDALDQQLDESSFVYLGSSHNPFVEVSGNFIRCTFPNINLPDSTTDEPNSHGYVQYKVKLDSGLPIGTTIENTAAIYFDFNPPVITNTTVNTLVAPTGISEIDHAIFTLYPNPASYEINIHASNPDLHHITLTDFTGRIIFQSKFSGYKFKADVSGFALGMYFVTVATGETRSVSKIVVK